MAVYQLITVGLGGSGDRRVEKQRDTGERSDTLDPCFLRQYPGMFPLPDMDESQAVHVMSPGIARGIVVSKD